ncbi:MAG: AroM family protein [Chloroflexi bacterium]|nr:AroM family protein [Chloroflexota bacterium]
MPTVAALEIGQSCRPDLVAELRAVLPDDVRILEVGALDGIDPATVPPIGSDAANPLSTRLADGRQVVVDEAWIAPHLQAAVRRAEAAGADALLLLCAGGFHDLASDRPLIRPAVAVARVLHERGVATMLVVVPLPGQVPASEAKWRALGFDPVVLATPLPAGLDQVVEAAEQHEAVVLDFVGHPADLIDRLEQALGSRGNAQVFDLGRYGALAMADLARVRAPVADRA